MNQLVGQLVLLPDIEPTEVISLNVGDAEYAYEGSRIISFEALNLMTRETATSLLLFLHQLSSRTYIIRFYNDSTIFQYLTEPNRIRVSHSGQQLNQMIFDVLRLASGKRVVNFYACKGKAQSRQSMFGETKNVKIHYKAE